MRFVRFKKTEQNMLKITTHEVKTNTIKLMYLIKIYVMLVSYTIGDMLYLK